MSRIVHTSRSLVLLAGLVMFGGVAVAPAMAATITYNFTGTVNFVGNNLKPNAFFHKAPPLDPTSTMTGTMTVNTSDGTSGGLLGTYTIQAFDLHVGTYNATFNHNDGQTVTIRNGTGNGAGVDRFLVSAGVDGSTVTSDSRTPRLFTINLRGENDIFTGPQGDALPNPAPSVSSFLTKTFRLQFGNGNGDGRAVTGSLTSLTAVPLPAGVVLFGVGLVALIGLGAGGLRNLRLPQA